ncbi:hypothetical protein ACFY1U_00370 [Streptomyces sp. NPDC001351]|uniref:hypothetical protein n=1 Tax=Streptomyces sp. NPDC001351 TaxID=3364564 RepID=UPI00367B7E8E
MATQSSKMSATPRDAAPTVARQPDGLGKRVGEVAEITVLLDAKPGGAERFRRNAAKIQDDAFHYEKLVGTVHDFRVTFINNDTQVVGAVTYDGDFKPYMADIFANAGPWFDEMFDGVIEGYPGASDPGIVNWLAPKIVEADMWYASNPSMTVEDTAKAQKVSEAFNALLDAVAD